MASAELLFDVFADPIGVLAGLLLAHAVAIGRLAPLDPNVGDAVGRIVSITKGLDLSPEGPLGCPA